MTFLNPVVLFGLIAASIPLILHLFTLRRVRTIEFSTLSFLKELQQTKIRKLKLRQLLLLLIRTLIIISIVIAFARPALRGTILGNIGTNANSTIIIILDDSFSLITSDENGELFKQAKETIEKIIDLFKKGDEVFLIKLSDLPNITVYPATHDFSFVRTIIKESKVSYIHKSITDALRLSAKFLSQTKNANKEIYIVSDFQKTHFKEDFVGNEKENLNLFDDNVRVFNIQIGNREASNVAIDSIEVQSKILEKDKPIKIRASIKNFSNIKLQNYVISIYLGDRRVAQGNVDVEPWGTASSEFSILVDKTGFIKCYADLENDNIEYDNRRYFTLYIPEKINIAVIANSSDDIKYLTLALTTNTVDNTKQSLFEINETVQPNMSYLDFKNNNVLIISNIKSFSQNEAERIKEFVNQGGGVILFPGTNIQKENYNTILLPTLNIPPIDEIIENTRSASSFVFDKIDLDHPLFENVFEKELNKKSQRDISFESPNIYKTLKRTAGKQAHTVISLNNGVPFLSEYELGKGRILFYSLPPDLSWSNFPLKGIFAPLIYRSVIYTSSQTKSQPNFTCGDMPYITVLSNIHNQNVKKYRMIMPDKTEELIFPITQLTSKQYTSSQITLKPNQPLLIPGFYEIKADNSLISAFSVNIDKAESDCRKISSDELESFLEKLGIKPSSAYSVEKVEHLQTKVLQSRFGIELWKHFVGLALLLALLEMIIARDSRKAIQQITS